MDTVEITISQSDTVELNINQSDTVEIGIVDELTVGNLNDQFPYYLPLNLE